MKKIIAIVMALVMMMAVAVPAFAAEINKDSEQVGQATVATTTSDTDATYTIEYPAEFIFAWDSLENKDAEYKVTSQLPIGDSIAVKVTASNGGVMTSTTATEYTLTYTLTGGEEQTFAEINNAKISNPIKVSIPQEQWDAAVPAVYTGYVTYNVAYTAA